MDHPPQGRTRRKALGDATLRANEDTSAQRFRSAKSNYEKASFQDVVSAPVPSSAHRPMPHNESLVPKGSGKLAVRHPSPPQPSPPLENKRLSAVINDQARPHNPKRDSEISNASTNASGTGRRRKTHIGPWQLGKTVGRGGCSRVRVVRHSATGEFGAAKIISKAMADKVRAVSLANLIESAENDPTLIGSDSKLIPFGLEREICIMKLLDHPNIVHLHDIWENSNELYLIMEYIEGGELFQYIGERGILEEMEVVYLFRQIIAALLYCHRVNIHHRDLKPENILLDKSTFQIKLVDFGMAALQPVGKKLTTPCGSPHYAAPEVIKTESYDGGKADIWSCGVILYVMLTGAPPFNYPAFSDMTPGAEEHGLKYLFRSITRAEYIMPSELSLEAQDLIRKILVPDPQRRISIEDIWDHPFMHKYDDRLGYEGEKTTLQYWVGPMPSIASWIPLTRPTIDREILRYLRTLWHSEKEENLLRKLLSKEPNQEKYFYSALVKYRNDQLEDYSPGHMVAYSNSDHHHHVNRAPTSQDLLELPTHKRSRSAYSILNNEHMYSDHSFYEPPQSEASYDPFRASRDALVPVPGNALNQNVTIHRGSGSARSKARPATALGHRTESSLRIKALRNNSTRQSSIISRGSSKRSTPSTRSGHSAGSQKSATGRQRSMSRSSMASYWPSSPPVGVRTASLGKRGVSFSHVRRSSQTSANTVETAGVQYTPEQRGNVDKAREPAERANISSPRPTVSAHPTLSSSRRVTKAAASPAAPHLKIRKQESPSKYINSECRKVSTELEKAMDEAFNRSSISSSVRTTTTDRHRDIAEYDTPPTSFSNTANRDSGCSYLATPQSKGLGATRPLPPIPHETPNSFLQRKLAETREEITRRLKQDSNNVEHYNEVLERLDRIMQPAANANGSKRAFSAPTKSPEHPVSLPPISEENKVDGEGLHEFYDAKYRAVTDPVRPGPTGRRSASETIRIVDRSPTPLGRPVDSPPRVLPLNIRKRSVASTQSQEPAVRSYEGVQRDLLAARTNGATPSPVPSHVSDKKESTIKKKKSSWFRRNFEDKEKDKERERQQAIQPKPSTARLQIPESWQGLDDRIAKSTCASPTHPPTEGSTTSEFPIRNCVTSASRYDSTKERKSFLGIFGKKPKEDKGKSPIDFAANFSSSSILSGFESVEDAPGAATRAPDVQTNWLSRFLHIKPANKVLCFHASRGKVKHDMVRLLQDWQRFGVRDIKYDCNAPKWNTVHAKVDKNNHLKIKPVSFVIEIFVVLMNGRRAGLCIARLTQTKGAASSFRKVADIIEDVFSARGMLVEDASKKEEMCGVLGL